MTCTRSLARRPWLALGLAGLVGATGCVGGHGKAGAPSAGFTLRATPTGLEIPAGGSGYAVISATRNGAAGDAIALAMTGLPTGVVASGTIPASASSGQLIIVVDAQVTPQTLASLTLAGQSGTSRASTAFALTITPALPATQLSPDQVLAPGGGQSGGAWSNTAVVMEPVAHDPASSPSGAVRNRSGFLPVPSPSLP